MRTITWIIYMPPGAISNSRVFTRCKRYAGPQRACKVKGEIKFLGSKLRPIGRAIHISEIQGAAW